MPSRRRPSRRQRNPTGSRQGQPLESGPSPSSPLQTFRSDWNRVVEEDVDIDAYCRQWDEATRASGEVLSEAYLAQCRARQLTSDELTGEIQRALLRGLLQTLSTSETEKRHAASLLMVASILVPELRTARVAQAVQNSAGILAVAAPMWAVQETTQAGAAAQDGTVSLDRAFGLTAPKGKTSEVKAGDKRQRDLTLVMAVEQLHAQHDMSIEDACEHVAGTTGRVSAGTLVNTYARLKQEQTVSLLLDIVRFLVPHHEQDLEDACRNLGFWLCEQMDLPVSPPTRIARRCLDCNAPFQASDRITRRCPACHQRNRGHA